MPAPRSGLSRRPGRPPLPSEFPASTTWSRSAAARTSSSTRPYQASLPRQGRRGSLSPGWPGRSTTVAIERSDSARSHGRAAAALKPVPGTSTTCGLPRPAEMSTTCPALVSTAVLSSGKSARAKVSEHHCRTAIRPRGLLYTAGTAPVSPAAPAPSSSPSPSATPQQQHNPIQQTDHLPDFPTGTTPAPPAQNRPTGTPTHALPAQTRHRRKSAIRRRTRWTCASSPAGASGTTCRCSRSTAPTCEWLSDL